MGASGHALRDYVFRELDFSFAARQVRVKFIVIDVMYPVPSVAKLTEQGFKVEFGRQARLLGMNSRSDAFSVEIRRRSGTCWEQMVSCTAKATTVRCDTVGDGWNA